MPLIRVRKTGKLRGVPKQTQDYMEKDNWTEYNRPRQFNQKNYLFPRYDNVVSSTIQRVPGTFVRPINQRRLKRRSRFKFLQ